MKEVLKHVATYLAAVVLGCFIVETGYRVYLLFKDPRIELRPQNPEDVTVTALTRSLWRYDAAEGFRYTDRSGVFGTTVKNGRIVQCRAIDPINAEGSPGIAEGKYEDAEIKIAIFGNSFSIFIDQDNLTWVNYLQRILQQKLGRSVHILNFSRDGSPLVQMFDVAASEIDKRKFDLAIVAFDTATEGPRSWRVEMTINGEPRVFTTTVQTKTPDITDRKSTYDTFILHPGIDAAWCKKYKNGGALDKVGREIISKYFRFRLERYSAFTLRRSFFWDRVVNHDAFYSGQQHNHAGKQNAIPLNADTKLQHAIQTIRANHVPLLLVHLPVSTEVAAQQEF
jgi:hypothetical protein